MDHPEPAKPTTRLILADGSILDSPTPGDLRQALAVMDGKRNGRLTIEHGPDRHLHCAGAPDQGFAIELADGHPSRQFMSAGDAISASKTTDVLVSYLVKDDRWRTLILWQPATDLASKPVGKPKRKRRRIFERDGKALVINRRFCLNVGGILCFLLGVALFFAVGFTGAPTTRVQVGAPGELISIGIILLIVAEFTDD